jgi:hypothetical protein
LDCGSLEGEIMGMLDGRVALVTGVAAVILGLATTMSFVNGTIIPVDGGSLL